MYRCPKCHSADIKRGSLSLERPEGSPFSTVAMIDFYCFNCHTLEQSRTDEPTYEPMVQRWTAPA